MLRDYVKLICPTTGREARDVQPVEVFGRWYGPLCFFVCPHCRDSRGYSGVHQVAGFVSQSGPFNDLGPRAPGGRRAA